MIGLQVNPTRTSKSERTMPSKPRIVVTAGSDALSTVLQHWTGPVLQSLDDIGVDVAVAVTVTVVGEPPQGMATARMGRARSAKALEKCMML